MKLAAICCTYKRPQALATAIECFRRQDYPEELRELIVLDDAGQYGNRTGDGWRLLSLPVRFRTLGEKRNACAGLASPDVDAYCVWDDDDVYLPWHMGAAAAALEASDYAIPSALLCQQGDDLTRLENASRLYHPSWSYRREAFDRAGGYPFMQSGEDQHLRRRFERAGLECGDPLELDPRPSFVYRWFSAHETHLSALGEDGYERLGDEPFERVERIEPRWERDWVELAATVSRGS